MENKQTSKYKDLNKVQQLLNFPWVFVHLPHSNLNDNRLNNSHSTGGVLLSSITVSAQLVLEAFCKSLLLKQPFQDRFNKDKPEEGIQEDLSPPTNKALVSMDTFNGP